MFHDATCSRTRVLAHATGARTSGGRGRGRAMMSARQGVIVLVPVIASHQAAWDEVGVAHAAAGIGSLEV